MMFIGWSLRFDIMHHFFFIHLSLLYTVDSVEFNGLIFREQHLRNYLLLIGD